MVMDETTFRATFPEFADTTVYTPEMIEFWAGIGDKLLNVDRWRDLLGHGLDLYVAHKITLQAQDIAAAAKGKSPGQSGGIASSKSVGGVSVSYDVGSFSLQDAGNYNMTRYGRDFWALIQIVGMGGAQV